MKSIKFKWDLPTQHNCSVLSTNIHVYVYGMQLKSAGDPVLVIFGPALDGTVHPVGFIGADYCANKVVALSQSSCRECYRPWVLST